MKAALGPLMFALAFVGIYATAGCGSSLAAIDDPEYADVARKLADCRAEARGAVQIGATPSEAWLVYEKCKTEHGLSGAGKDGGP